MNTKHRGTRLWLLAFAGFFLLHAGWAFAAPYNGPPDEQAHTLRAAAVGHGELLPSKDQGQETPRGLYRKHCFEMDVTMPASCAREPGFDPTLVHQFVSAGFYNPVYYAVTGWPVAVWPNWTGILMARLLTGAAMAGLLASAVVAAARWTRYKSVLCGLVVGITPMTASLGGAINPNGIEIAAGTALFAGLIPLLSESRDRINRAAVALVGVSASVLVTPRALGVMWLGVIAVTLLIGTPRAHLRSLARERVVRGWLVVIAISVAASMAWNFIARPLAIPSGDLGMTFKDVLRGAFIDIWPNIANQMIGGTSWAEILQPRLIYVAWFMAAGILVLGGFALGDRTDRLRMLVLFGGTFVPLIGWELLRANEAGWFNNGRYFLPGAVGLPMLGAYVLARRGLTSAHLRSLTRTLAALLLPVHVIVLAYTMCRWQSGLQILNPLKGSWLPLLGPVVPLVAEVLGTVVLGVMYWRASRGAEDASDQPSPAVRDVEDVPSERVFEPVS